MVLESVIYGKSELTYRLKRNISLLIGETALNCNRIYSNIKKLYDLRSSIVHGEEYDHTKMLSYMPYLKSLASRVLIELLIHNYPKNKDLDNKLTQLGFGAKMRISENYKVFHMNMDTYMSVNYKDV